MRYVLLTCYGCVLATLTPTLLRAAVVEVNPVSSWVLNPDFTPVAETDILGPGLLRPRDDAYLIQVDVSMRIYDLQPGQVGFSNTAFNVELGGNGAAYSDLNLGIRAWTPADGPDLDCPGCNPMNMWDMNDDYGIDNNDLQAVILSGITKSFGPVGRDPRRTLGQDEDGEYAGSFFISLPGAPGSTAYADMLTLWGASTYDAAGISSTANNTALGGRTMTYEVVPEPSTLGLAVTVFAFVAVLHRRRLKTARRLAAIGLAALFPVSVNAAEVEVAPSASWVMNPDFSPVDPAMIRADGRLMPRDDYYLIQVDVSMRIYDLQPGQEGFSNTAFNVEVYGDGEAYSAIDLGVNGWTPAYLYDLNGQCVPTMPNCTPVNLWDLNADSGLDTNDLQGIILAGITRGFGPPEFDRRRVLGQDQDGDFAGNFYIRLPGTPGATTYAETLTPWGASTYDEHGFSTTENNTTIGGRTMTYEVVPEPASVLLLALSASIAALLWRRWTDASIFVVVAFSVSPEPSSAAIVEVFPEAVAVLGMDFVPVDESFIVAPGKLLPREEPYLIQVDVSMRIYDLQPGQVGFSNTAFNGAAHGDGVVFNDNALGVPSWTRDETIVWPWFQWFRRPLWWLNHDDGPDHDDLQAIILAGETKDFGPVQFDIRRNLGKSEDGTYAGKFYVSLPATLGAWTHSEITTPWGASTYDETGFSTTAGNTAIGGRTITFTVVPEPSGAFLLTLGVASFAAYCGRRPTPTPQSPAQYPAAIPPDGSSCR